VIIAPVWWFRRERYQPNSTCLVCHSLLIFIWPLPIPNYLFEMASAVDRPSLTASNESLQDPTAANLVVQGSSSTQKRSRIQFSCTNCRHAKLKCDRERPCSQCIKKGRPGLCIYPAAPTRKKHTASMHNRLKHLESLLKDVITGQSLGVETNNSNKDTTHQNDCRFLENIPGAGASSSSLPETSNPRSSGRVYSGINETVFIGATHWAAILDDVSFIFIILTPSLSILYLSKVVT
jgi:hypothetical protein